MPNNKAAEGVQVPGIKAEHYERKRKDYMVPPWNEENVIEQFEITIQDHDAVELRRQVCASMTAFWQADDAYMEAKKRIATLTASLDAKERELALLKLRSHKWTGRQMGGNPANAESYEWIRFCDYCGMEDTCEEDMPACEVTRETLAIELAEANKRVEWLTRPVSQREVIMASGNSHPQSPMQVASVCFNIIMARTREGQPGSCHGGEMKDYLEAVIIGKVKWVTDSIKRGRRICLYGVDVALTQHGEKLEMSPAIPALSPLLRLIEKHPNCDAFEWKAKKWRAISGQPEGEK